MKVYLCHPHFSSASLIIPSTSFTFSVSFNTLFPNLAWSNVTALITNVTSSTLKANKHRLNGHDWLHNEYLASQMMSHSMSKIFATLLYIFPLPMTLCLIAQKITHYNPPFPFAHLLFLYTTLIRYTRLQDLNTLPLEVLLISSQFYLTSSLTHCPHLTAPIPFLPHLSRFLSTSPEARILQLAISFYSPVVPLTSKHLTLCILNVHLGPQ